MFPGVLADITVVVLLPGEEEKLLRLTGSVNSMTGHTETSSLPFQESADIPASAWPEAHKISVSVKWHGDKQRSEISIVTSPRPGRLTLLILP